MFKDFGPFCLFAKLTDVKKYQEEENKTTNLHE